MRLRENLVIKKIVGIDVIIPIGQALVEGLMPVQLNEQESYLCKILLNEEIEVEKLIEKFMVNYQVTEDEAYKFVNGFVDDCKEYKYIISD